MNSDFRVNYNFKNLEIQIIYSSILMCSVLCLNKLLSTLLLLLFFKTFIKFKCQNFILKYMIHTKFIFFFHFYVSWSNLFFFFQYNCQLFETKTFVVVRFPLLSENTWDNQCKKKRWFWLKFQRFQSKAIVLYFNLGYTDS